MKSKPSKSKFFPVTLTILVLAIVVLVGKLILNGGSLLSSVLNTNPISVSIEPSTMSMTLAESHTFTSYATVSTGQVKVNADWSLKSNASTDKTSYSSVDTSSAPVELSATGNNGIFLEGCNSSETCVFHSGTTAKDVTLVATVDGKSAEVPVHITADLPPNPFPDTIPDWAQSMVYSLHNLGVIKGFADGSFGASQTLTKGQAIVLLYNLTRIYGVDTSPILTQNSCDVLNVKKEHYAYDAICFAYYSSWLKDLDMFGGFNPDSPILRNEVAQIVYNFLGDNSLNANIHFHISDTRYIDFIADLNYLEQYSQDYFPDVKSNPKYSAAITAVFFSGIMNGTPDPVKKSYYFRPGDKLNRAEMATIMGRVINLIAQVYKK